MSILWESSQYYADIAWQFRVDSIGNRVHFYFVVNLVKQPSPSWSK